MSDTNTEVVLSPEEELAQAFYTPEGEEAVVPAPAAVAEVEAPAEEAPSATPPPQGDPPPAPSFVPFTITHNGQEITISSLEEAREYGQKGFDYTKKTMDLAEQSKKVRQFVELVRQQEEQRRAELRAFLSDDARVEQYLQALRQSKGQAAPAPSAASPESDDFEPVSRQELARVTAEVTAESEKKAKATIVEALEQIEIQRMGNDYRSDFDRTVKGLITQTYPILSDVEGVERLIMEDGQRFFQAQVELNPHAPVDPKAVKAVMIESARRRAEKLDARVRVREKENVVRQAALTQRGPEGPGGTAPPAPTAKEFDLKSDELTQAVLADIQALMGR